MSFFTNVSLPLRNICQRSVIEDICDRVAHIAHDEPQATGLFVRAAAGFISHLTHALDRGDGSVQYTEDLPERELAGRTGKIIATTNTHLAVQQSGVLERKKDLFEEFG